MCPGNSVARGCDRSTDMFNYLFESQSDMTGNNAPPACFGGKCSGYDSTLGWETSQTVPGAVKWQASPDAGAGGCNTPLGL